jgi:sulfite exporter TauE/SafE
MYRDLLSDAWWMTELIVGLLPAFLTLCAGFMSYIIMVPFVVPHLLERTDGFVVLRTFLVLSGMVIGGILGLIGIWLALLWPELPHRSPLKYVAILFTCAGLLAEGLYVAKEGVSNIFSLWVVLGPLIVGVHCLYRVYRSKGRGYINRPANPRANKNGRLRGRLLGS